MSAPAPNPPTVAVELDSLEAELEGMQEAEQLILDIMLDTQDRSKLTSALMIVHGMSYAIRTWIRAEATS